MQGELTSRSSGSIPMSIHRQKKKGSPDTHGHQQEERRASFFSYIFLVKLERRHIRGLVSAYQVLPNKNKKRKKKRKKRKE
jgi:hypothetical protein